MMKGHWILGLFLLLKFEGSMPESGLRDILTSTPPVHEVHTTPKFSKHSTVGQVSETSSPLRTQFVNQSRVHKAQELAITTEEPDSTSQEPTSTSQEPTNTSMVDKASPYPAKEELQNSSSSSISSILETTQMMTSMSSNLNKINFTTQSIIISTTQSTQNTIVVNVTEENDFTTSATISDNDSQMSKRPLGQTTSNNTETEDVDGPEETTTVSNENTDSGNTNPNNEPKDRKSTSLWVLVLVLFIILCMILFIMIVLLVRRKKRSGSQTFNKRSRKGDKKDVWAGQVPELVEGKQAGEAKGAENGVTVPVSEAGKEEKLITFVSGEKKSDSVIEMDELAREKIPEVTQEKEVKEEDTVAKGEQTPLLEQQEVTPNSEVDGKDEQFPLPPMEQELIGNTDKTI